MSILDTINQARQAGYSDDAILSEIAKQNPDKAQTISQASSSGYAPDQIVNEIMKQNKVGFVQGAVQTIAKQPLQLLSSVARIGTGISSMVESAVGNKDKADQLWQKSQNIQERGMDLGYFGKVQPYGAKATPWENLKEAIGSGAEIGLDAATFIPGSILAGALKLVAPTSKVASTVSRLAAPLAKGTSDINTTMKVARLGVRAAENAGLGVAINTADNLAEGRDLNENNGTVAMIGGAFPIVGSMANTVLRKSSPWLINNSMRRYQSAMKPTGSPAERFMAVQTGLKEAIILSEGGIEKTVNKIDALEEQLGSVIDQAAGEGRTIKTASLKPFIESVKGFFKNISDVAKSDEAMQNIDDIYTNFIKKYGDELPVEEAQKIKTATYQWLKNSYGELAGPVKEANKQLVRGLKEGIVEAAPQAGDINARLARLYKFEAALEKSVGRARNWNMLGLGTKVLASSGNKFGVILAIANQVLGGLTNKSRQAVYMYKLGTLIEKLNPSERVNLFAQNPVLKAWYQRFTGVGEGGQIQRKPLPESRQLVAPGQNPMQMPSASDEYLKSLGL